MNMYNSKLTKVILIITLIYMFLPLFATLLYALSTSWSNTLLPEGLTFSWFKDMIGDPRFISALIRTVVVSVVSVAISLIIMLITVFTMLHYAPWAKAILKYVSVLPFAVPGVILSIGLIEAYVGLIPTISGRIVLLILAYCLLILPYIYQGIENGMANINAEQMSAAAEILGASKRQAFWKLVIPNIIPGIVSAVLLSLSVLFGEFVITNLLLGAQFETIQVYLYMRLKESGHFASAVTISYFIVEMILSGIVLKISSHQNRRSNNELCSG